MNQMTTETNRYGLLPLGTLHGTGVMVMALGIPRTSAGWGPGAIRLSADDQHGTTLTLTQLDQGESVTRGIAVRNTGATASRLSFRATEGPSSFLDGALHVVVEHDGRQVYDGRLAAMNDFVQDLGDLDPGESSTIMFTVSLLEEPAYVWGHHAGGRGGRHLELITA